jgi:hypothetical protein
MKMLLNSDAIYKRIAQNGINSLRPFAEDGKTYVINKFGEQIETQAQNDTVLPIDAWKKLDEDIASVIRTDINVFEDIKAVGTVGLGSMEEALGTFLYINQMSSDSGKASLSMTGKKVINNDQPVFSQEALPLPMINADFRMDVRSMYASANGAYGNGSNVRIDTSEAQNEARQVSEKLEDLAILGGGDFSYAGHSIYGMTNAPNRVQTTYAKEWSDSTKTFDECVADVRAWINLHFIQGTGGMKSLMLYIPSAWNVALSITRGTNSGISLKNFLLATFPELIDIKPVFRMTVNSVCLLEMRPRTVKVINGFAPTPISWMTPDGLEYNWKLLTLQIPKFYSDYNDVMGLVHATKA